MSSSKNVVDSRKRRKNNLVQVCGGKCSICGYNKTNSALEFHHIFPENKEFNISIGSHSLIKDLEEVKKCILVCSNCHREIHDGYYSTEVLLERKNFDELFSKTLLKDLEKMKEKTLYYCSNCGKEITRHSKSGLCESCSKKSKRVVNRPDREELKKLIRIESFVSIGKRFGVTDNAVRKWCKLENLPYNKKYIKEFTDKEWNEI